MKKRIKVKRTVFNTGKKIFAIVFMVCFLVTSITIPSFAKSTISTTSSYLPASETSPLKVSIVSEGSVINVHIYDETRTERDEVSVNCWSEDYGSNDFRYDYNKNFIDNQVACTIDLTGNQDGNYILTVCKVNYRDEYFGYGYYPLYLHFIYENGSIEFLWPNGQGEQNLIDEANATWNPSDYLDCSLWTEDTSNYDEIVQTAKDLTVNCTTDEQKVRVIHDWICSNFAYYSVERGDFWNACRPEWVFVNKKANNRGFARLFNLMLRSLGVPVVNISGWYSNKLLPDTEYSDYHISSEANLVYYNNKWRFFDLSEDCKNYYYGEGAENNLEGTRPSHMYYDAPAYLYGQKHITLCKTYDEEEHPVEGIGTTPINPTVKVGAQFDIEVNFAPWNATNRNVTWQSNNPSVATVDSDGNVIALSPGEAIVTATTEDGGFTANCYITVESESEVPEYPDDPEEPENIDEPEYPDDPEEPIDENGDLQCAMYRLYNPYTEEHFYTSNKAESEFLAEAGWEYEGIGWIAPDTGDPVYRLYNPYTGKHHYTMMEAECDYLVDVGWNYEGIGWYSSVEQINPLYRLYNPYTYEHHYTANA